MINITIPEAEIRKFKADIREYKRDIRKELEKETARTAYAIELRAKQNAPHVTGFLKASGKVILKGLEASVKFLAKYAVFVEYGTRHFKGRLFLTRAINIERVKFQQNIKRILSKKRSV